MALLHEEDDHIVAKFGSHVLCCLASTLANVTREGGRLKT